MDRSTEQGCALHQGYLAWPSVDFLGSQMPYSATEFTGDTVYETSYGNQICQMVMISMTEECS